MLIFRADENMLDLLPRKKVVVPQSIHTVLHNRSDMPHIRGMMRHNVVGVALLPFIIL